MRLKNKIILIATIFSIVLTSLIFLIPVYERLWLLLEIIILPVIYIVGYEELIREQKREFEEDYFSVLQNAKILAKTNYKLKLENIELKKKLK